MKLRGTQRSFENPCGKNDTFKKIYSEARKHIIAMKCMFLAQIGNCHRSTMKKALLW